MEKYKILLVDDERSEREGVSFLIEKFGYPLEIKEACNGEKALEMMEEEHFDILFTDVKMPVMDGLELSRRASKLCPDTLIIIFSAYSEFDFVKKALEAGVMHYLVKPIEIDEFRQCMEGALDRIRKNRSFSSQEIRRQDMAREALLYRFFRTGKFPKEDKQIVEELLFHDSRQCHIAYFEFVANYFQTSGREFTDAARGFFKEMNFIDLLPNEAFVVIRKRKDNDTSGYDIEIEVEALLKNLKNREECFVIISEAINSAEEMGKQLELMMELRKTSFLYGDKIILAGECKGRTQIHIRDIEDVKKDIFAAIDRGETKVLREAFSQLRISLMSTKDISRIYIQHLLYSIVKELYEKHSHVEFEDAGRIMEEVFSGKRADKILDDFIFEMNRLLVATAKKEKRNDSTVVGRIKQFIDKEYKRELTLTDVAAEVNLAPAYVSHIFKKEMGQGIVEYITALKMKEAKLLLGNRSLKIVQIAKFCGYDNQSYFNRLFKAHYGMTPKQYREEL